MQAVVDKRIGAVLGGRYQIDSEIGSGGMATVYRARHTVVDRVVAIKILKKEFAGDSQIRERFRREARNTANLAHPNIIEIYDFGEADDASPYFVMELLDGEPLSRILKNGAIPWPQAVRLCLQMARGLARAHDFQVIHRDLKPDNIMVCRSDRGPVVKLLDFGIARSMNDRRLTSYGQVFGTPPYMAPERIVSIDAGPAADLYSLGVILYECITGQLPFEGRDLSSLFGKILHAAPTRPSELAPACPPRLEALILQMLAKKAEERPVDAHRVIQELTQLEVGTPELVVLPPTPPNGSRRALPGVLPTGSIAMWARRAAVFEEMLRRAFPKNDAPVELKQALADYRELLSRVQELRVVARDQQSEVDRIEQDAREARERLGHAVEVLAVDLSQIRDRARIARADVASCLSDEERARDAYRVLHEQLCQMPSTPSVQGIERLRQAAHAMERWHYLHDANTEIRERAEQDEREMRDLEFQIETLRTQQAHLQERFDVEQDRLKESLKKTGENIEQLESQLLVLASRFTMPLRPRRELSDLFQQLEASSS